MSFNDISTYRHLAQAAAASLVGLSMALAACTSASTGSTQNSSVATMKQQKQAAMVYVGTYAQPDQESIFLYRLNPGTGELTRESAFKAGENPSYLTLDKQRRYLYAVNETGNYQRQNSGAVSTFAVDQQTGGLTLLNQVPSMGSAPCHISVDEKNKTVLVANYTGGNVAAFKVQENGALAAATSVQQHNGSGPTERQQAPHAHYIAPSPDGKYAFAVDLGTDQILGYHLGAGEALQPNEPAVAFATTPGAGPRHMAFHPNKKYAYLINELNSTMVVLAYDQNKGTFSELQTIGTLPVGFDGKSYCAAVKVSPDGKFLYGSNRGHNSIVVYSIDASSGKLTLVQHQDTGGNWPRDFTIDLTGTVMLVANERSNNIVSFKIDKATGKLTPAGHEVAVPKPVNLQVVPAF